MTKYRFILKTVQSSAFKTLIEALKDILTECNFEFDSKGIRAIAMDNSHTVLVHLKLEMENFELYECKQKTVIGLNMLNFFKLIRTMTTNDTLTLSLDEANVNLLIITIENGEKNTITNYKLNLIDLNEDNIKIPPTEFESVITMPSNGFQKLCKDMINIGDKVEIRSIGKQLIFTCQGEFAEQETIIGENTGTKFEKNDESHIIQGVFSLKHLVMFTKCTNLSNSIEVMLKNDYPIIVKYQVASLGNINLCLAPQVSNDTESNS
jgi:proliferating cell nuclear antigen